jgi:hypothetical protein
MGRLDRALDAFRRLADAVGARAVPSALSAGRLLTTPPESRMLPRGQRPEAAE